VICPGCSNASIYPIDLAGWGRAAIDSRRCPACGIAMSSQSRDSQLLFWFERIARERDELAAICDAIGDGLPLEPCSW
jgi:hypothetical protein